MDAATRQELLKALTTDPEFREAIRAALADATTEPSIPLVTPPEKPIDVSVGVDGVYFRTVATTDRDGNITQVQVRVCEDCWQPIPQYVDFPRGLVSPESDGDEHGNGIKQRYTAVGPKMGWEHVSKVVCLNCYLAAFARVYPTAPLPTLRADYIETVEPYEEDTSVVEFIDEPKEQAAGV